MEEGARQNVSPTPQTTGRSFSMLTVEVMKRSNAKYATDKSSVLCTSICRYSLCQPMQ